jgi:hypothetical protein
MDEGHEPQLEAGVVIRKGMRFIDRNGRAVISGGSLALLTQSGEVVAQAPITEVRADKTRMSGGTTARVYLGDECYKLDPSDIRHISPRLETLSAAATTFGRSVKEIKHRRELTELFIRALKAEGGHTGE